MASGGQYASFHVKYGSGAVYVCRHGQVQVKGQSWGNLCGANGLAEKNLECKYSRPG